MTSDTDRRFDELCRRLEGEDHQDERPRRVPRYPEDAALVVGFGLGRHGGPVLRMATPCGEQRVVPPTSSPPTRYYCAHCGWSALRPDRSSRGDQITCHCGRVRAVFHDGGSLCVPLDEGMPAIEDAIGQGSFRMENCTFSYDDEPPCVPLPGYASERDVVSPPRASLDDVPLRGLLRIAWAETRAGLRDAWRRLASAIKDGV